MRALSRQTLPSYHHRAISERRTMPPRQTSGTPDYKKALAKSDAAIRELAAKFDHSFGALLVSIGGIQEEVRRGAVERATLLKRFGDLELQVNAYREDIQRFKSTETEAAAKGAAAGAGESAATAAVQVAVVAAHATSANAGRNFWRSWRGQVTAWAAAFTAVMLAIKNVPDFVRGAAHLVAAMYQFVVTRH